MVELLYSLQRRRAGDGIVERRRGGTLKSWTYSTSTKVWYCIVSGYDHFEFRYIIVLFNITCSSQHFLLYL